MLKTTNMKIVSLGVTLSLLLSILVVSVIFVPTVSAAPTFTEYTVTSSLHYAYDTYPIDIDNDGDIDIMAISQTVGAYIGNISWFENTGDYSNWPQHDIFTSYGGNAVWAYDFEGNGYPDSVAACYSEDEINWYNNSGTPASGEWAEHLVKSGWSVAYVVQVEDIDQDGDGDIISVPPHNSNYAWFENDGQPVPTFTERTIGSGSSFHGLYVGDIDGDGWLDCVTGEGGSVGAIKWWKNDGTPASGTWTSYMIDSSIQSPIGIFIADVDGDGDNDVISYNEDGTHFFAWWENDGTPETGEWTRHYLQVEQVAPHCVHAYDLDNDGDMDIFGAGVVSDKIYWWENDGQANPSFTEHVLLSSCDGAIDVFVYDVDQDGDADVIVCAEVTKMVMLMLLFVLR